MDEDVLEKQAIEEIIKDTKKAAIRAESGGAHLWAKPKIPVTNKRFLRNIIRSSLAKPSVQSVSQNRKTTKGTASKRTSHSSDKPSTKSVKSQQENPSLTIKDTNRRSKTDKKTQNKHLQ